MFAYQLLEPPCDEWKDYYLPQLCESKVTEICKDILKKGEKTSYQKIYDAIYELVEAEIESEHLENLGAI